MCESFTYSAVENIMSVILSVSYIHLFRFMQIIITSCRRAATTVSPHPSPPSVCAEAPRAAELNAPADHNVAVGSPGQYVPTLTTAAA